MSLDKDIETYVALTVAKLMGKTTTTGTVVTSPQADTDDPLTVVLDGSAVAVPVKQLRVAPVFPGQRVGLIKFGSDWTLIGPFPAAGSGTGAMRMVLGAETPPELLAYNINIAMLFYVPDNITQLEMGYFFIGLTNILDDDDQKSLLFGSVMYPTPGNPGSATLAEVKVHFQINLGHPGAKFTVFKDVPVEIFSSVPNFFISNHFVTFRKVADPAHPGRGQILFENENVFFGDPDPARYAQALFYNDVFLNSGAHLYLQSGAVLHMRGDVVYDAGWPIGREYMNPKPTVQGTSVVQPTFEYDQHLFVGGLPGGTYEIEVHARIGGPANAAGVYPQLCSIWELAGTTSGTLLKECYGSPPENTALPADEGSRARQATHSQVSGMGTRVNYRVEPNQQIVRENAIITFVGGTDNRVFFKFARVSAAAPVGDVTVAAGSYIKVKRWA